MKMTSSEFLKKKKNLKKLNSRSNLLAFKKVSQLFHSDKYQNSSSIKAHILAFIASLFIYELRSR